MAPHQEPDMKITVELVKELITHQFPQWAHMPIRPVECGGHDNRTFHLGEEMVIRLPSAEEYAGKVHIEQTWLPLLAPKLSLTIPHPLALGQSSTNYPWNWSIYQWIEGKSLNTVHLNDHHLKLLATDLAQFLHELHAVDTHGAPAAGPHNFFRGAHPLAYDSQTRLALAQLKDIIDVAEATAVWEKALRSSWNKNPVWIHGDLAPGNILVKESTLTAVIDFGGMGSGDPACDLVIAWTLFNKESRKAFKAAVCLDEGTWARARGWALWKALITLAELQDTSTPDALHQLHIIKEIILDSNLGRSST